MCMGHVWNWQNNDLSSLYVWWEYKALFILQHWTELFFKLHLHLDATTAFNYKLICVFPTTVCASLLLFLFGQG